jgi:hypothetical protein
VGDPIPKDGPSIVNAQVRAAMAKIEKASSATGYRVRFIVDPKTMTIRMELVDDDVTIEWDEKAAEAIHDGIGSSLEELRKYKPRAS